MRGVGQPLQPIGWAEHRVFELEQLTIARGRRRKGALRFRAMQRVRVGLISLLVLSCGARTGLLSDSDQDLPPRNAGGQLSAGGSPNNSGGRATGGGGSGGVTIVPPPVKTNCQLSGDDPRVAGIKPDEIARLDGADFVIGEVASYHWTVQMEDCDAVVQNAQIILQDVDSRVLTFQPSRPAFYHFTLEVTGVGGDRTSCKLEVPVKGVGMRVELCWDTSTTADLDLYLHTPLNQSPWFTPGASNIRTGLNGNTCNTSNGAAELRNGLARVDWGYADSALSACNTPPFQAFSSSGRCPNPRAADDNNQELATGTTERMQLDAPTDGQRFRVMVQNFNNAPARPHVFVYCGGERSAAIDAPTMPINFVAQPEGVFGVMWRATDITTRVDPSGKVWCQTETVPGSLTLDDSRF
jgi:hypothetical protein